MLGGFGNMKKELIKIFVSAYACEPGKGSEVGVGWHWVLEMSKYFELWVLTRANNKNVIENYFQHNPADKRDIHWVYYDCPDWIKKHKHQMRGVRTYYTLWQYGSNHLVKSIMNDNHIEVFHLLTYGNAIWHISSYGQKKIFIWGPTGGMDTIPREFSKHYSTKQRIIEQIRRIAVEYTKNSYGFRKKCANASLIFCKSSSMYNSIPDKYRKKAILFTDVAMERRNTDLIGVETSSKRNLTYLSVGRLDGWRGFDLIIEAYRLIKDQHPEIQIKIIGDGIEKKHLESLIHKYNLQNNIFLLGQLPMQDYFEEMSKCDGVINACLKEGGVTNAFDCMTWGKPLICIDTGGYTGNFDESCAIILKQTNRTNQIVQLKEAMCALTDDGVRKHMSSAIKEKGQCITWEIKGRQIRDIILKTWDEKQLSND